MGGKGAGCCLLVFVHPDGEADALASRYTLRNLRPGTAYRVGIQEVAADGGGSCSTPWHFQTMALGNGWGPLPSPSGDAPVALLCC